MSCIPCRTWRDRQPKNNQIQRRSLIHQRCKFRHLSLIQNQIILFMQYTEDHPRFNLSFYGQNIWPEASKLPSFKTTIQSYFNDIQNFGMEKFIFKCHYFIMTYLIQNVADVVYIDGNVTWHLRRDHERAVHVADTQSLHRPNSGIGQR